MSAGAVAKRRQEKLQAAIRDLGKKKENKLCFDCKKNGPQPSVCLDFGIFVCNSCGGLHRGYNHKVKGISMTSFSDAEYESLLNGGNKKARRIWLAKYKKSSFLIDDDTPVSRIKVFIYKCFEQKVWHVPHHSGTKKHEKRRRTRRKEKPKIVAPASNGSSRHSEESHEEYFSAEEEEEKSRHRTRAASEGDSIMDILDLNKITMFPSHNQPNDSSGGGAPPSSVLDTNLLVAPDKRVQAPASQPVTGTNQQQQQRNASSSRMVQSFHSPPLNPKQHQQQQQQQLSAAPFNIKHDRPHPNQVKEEVDVFSDLPRRVGGDTTDYQQRAVQMVLNQLRNLQTEYGFTPSNLKGICKQALMTLQDELERVEAQKAAAVRQQFEQSSSSGAGVGGPILGPGGVGGGGGGGGGGPPPDDGRNPFADEDETDENPFGVGDPVDGDLPETGGNPFADDPTPSSPTQQYPQPSQFHSNPPNWQHTSPQYPSQPGPGYSNPNLYSPPLGPQYPPNQYQQPPQQQQQHQPAPGQPFAQQSQNDPFSSLSSLK